jgi:hypothetical protein
VTAIVSTAGQIILVILAITGIRDILAFMGWVPRELKYSWLVYGRYDDALITRTLTNLGFSREDVERAASRARQPRTPPIKDPLSRLTRLLAGRLRKFDESINYGHKTLVTSKYYIDTMGAVHDDNTAGAMCELLADLISANLNRETSGQWPDFVVCPKLGNPMFGVTFARKMHLRALVSKTAEETSRVRFSNAAPESSLGVNFEGGDLLQQAISRARGRQLTGVLVDCNMSGGSMLLDAARQFNSLIDDGLQGVRRLDRAYVLFRPDSCAISPGFALEGIAVHRFVDLDEVLKDRLWDCRADCMSGKSKALQSYAQLLRDSGRVIQGAGSR